MVGFGFQGIDQVLGIIESGLRLGLTPVFEAVSDFEFRVQFQVRGDSTRSKSAPLPSLD
jgi:hypothetical protein